MIRLALVELRSWLASRRWIAVAAGVGSAALLVATGSLATSAASVPWWAWAASATTPPQAPATPPVDDLRRR